MHLTLSEYALLVGFTFSSLAILLSFVNIIQHLTHYRNRSRQSKIIRILWMVPLYAFTSWVSLECTLHRRHAIAEYLVMLRDCYDGLVIYTFFSLLVDYLDGDLAIVSQLREQPPTRMIPPLCCLPRILPGRKLLLRVRQGALQFVFMKPLLAVTTLVCQQLHQYRTGDLNPSRSYLYLMILQNISISIAMYSLVFFYFLNRKALAPFRPVSKFFCIKSVVFFSFWQGVVIAVLFRLGVMHPVPPFSERNVGTGIQDFLVCFEMFLAAIAHLYAFSYQEFQSSPPPSDPDRSPLLSRVRHVMDVTDLVTDTYHSFVPGAPGHLPPRPRPPDLRTPPPPATADGLRHDSDHEAPVDRSKQCRD